MMRDKFTLISQEAFQRDQSGAEGNTEGLVVLDNILEVIFLSGPVAGSVIRVVYIL
jgi:hypothetical protein